MLIPHRFALAMQAEGWIVRQDIVWAKGISCLPSYAGSCMPESARDRPTTGHEFIFLLAKGPRYYYDNVAVRESAATGYNGSSFDKGKSAAAREHLSPVGTKPRADIAGETGRNLRSVWAINPGSYSKAHFATFPPALPGLCLRAGTSAAGVCSACGSPYTRVVDRRAMKVRTSPRGAEKHALGLRTSTSGTMTEPPTVATRGWAPACTCDAAKRPATVLDPFNGAGTTGLAALHVNRRYIGIDLSSEYFSQTRDRFAEIQPMLPGIE